MEQVKVLHLAIPVFLWRLEVTDGAISSRSVSIGKQLWIFHMALFRSLKAGLNT
jgi:hypothetical protein